MAAVFNIDKKCEPSNIYLFLLMKLQMLFSYLHPSPYIHLKHVVWVIHSWGVLQRHDYNYNYD